jgi:hypothetical protein
VQVAPCGGPSQSRRSALSLCDLAAQCLGLHEVDERLLAVDLDYGNQLAVSLLELGIAADVDLLELEAELVAKLGDRRPRALAEVAVRGVVEDELD